MTTSAQHGNSFHSAQLSGHMDDTFYIHQDDQLSNQNYKSLCHNIRRNHFIYRIARKICSSKPACDVHIQFVWRNSKLIGKVSLKKKFIFYNGIINYKASRDVKNEVAIYFEDVQMFAAN